MRSIEASYRIVTPMFIGDADQRATGIRPPSVKGVLRFWWRALNWGRCLGEANRDEAEALGRLHHQESRLFGRAAVEENREQVGGQGCFLLRIRQPANTGSLVTDWPQNNTGSGYLGFGLFATKQQGHREGLREGLAFTLELRFKAQADEEDVASVREALRAWGWLGGLGSRARRGFGSVTLVSMDGQNELLSRSTYEAAVASLLQEADTVRAWPPFSAFSAHTHVRVLASGQDARRVHDQAGQLYKLHRGQSSTLRGATKMPFGLPLQKVDEVNRRASPLLFHVQELANDECLATALYLPAVFHHQDRYSRGTTEPERFYRDVARFVEQTEEQQV